MTAPVLAADAVAREELTYRARTWDARTRPYESLRELVNPALDPGRAGCACGHCLVSLWSTFMWDVKRLAVWEAEVARLAEFHEDLKDGREHWSNWREDFTCFDRQEAAIEESGTALEDARAELAVQKVRVAAGLDALTGRRA